ncbi:hypothetical protein KPATCC21470_4452 [Kitasatospora purpeofusca]
MGEQYIAVPEYWWSVPGAGGHVRGGRSGSADPVGRPGSVGRADRGRRRLSISRFGQV